ncbi:TFIIB1 [Symbiodinium sp. CCMP2592]|nr:TFIIB1 [Symbiodinium sp. CCMP2592]
MGVEPVLLLWLVPEPQGQMTDISIDPSKACKYCKGRAEVKVDASQGTLICTGCGLVLEDHCFDDTREWRSFAPEGIDSQGPARERADLSTAIDELTGEVGGTTILGSDTASRRMQMLTKQVQSHHKQELTEEQKKEQIIQRFTEKAREVAQRLRLGEEVVNRCTVLLQELADKGKLKMRATAPWFCALVDLACREEKIPKTLHDLAESNGAAIGVKEVELLSVQRHPNKPAMKVALSQGAVAKSLLKGSLDVNGVKVMLSPLQSMGSEAVAVAQWQGDEKAVTEAMLDACLRKHILAFNQARCEEIIAKHSKDLCNDLSRTRSHAAYFQDEILHRYVTRLGLAAQVVAPAKHIAWQALQQDVVKKGKGLLEHTMASASMAASIFVVSWLLDVEQKPRLGEVATVVKVSEGSVQVAYSSIRQRLRYLLPKDFVIRYKLGLEGLPKPQDPPPSRKRSADVL